MPNCSTFSKEKKSNAPCGDGDAKKSSMQQLHYLLKYLQKSSPSMPSFFCTFSCHSFSAQQQNVSAQQQNENNSDDDDMPELYECVD